jgi:hypothetical protein
LLACGWLVGVITWNDGHERSYGDGYGYGMDIRHLDIYFLDALA